MRRTHPTAATLFCLLALLASGCRPVARAPGARPSLVLISVDTLSLDRLRAFAPDAVPLPRLDALAAASARFQQAFAPAPWTLPSHASLLTGTYPDRHGATDPRRRIAGEVQLLSEVLRQAGYDTAGFTDGGFTDQQFGFARGFAIYNDRADGSDLAPYRLPRSGKPNRNRGATLFDRAIGYLRARRSDAPLFLFVQTYSVHDYFKVRPWAVKRLPQHADRSATEYRECIQGARECPPEDWDRLEALYQAEIEYLDEGLGALLETLADAGIAGNAYLALVSDHGEGFAPERHRIHHGGRLHADQIHIPLLISGPGVVPRDIDRPASLVDLMPTLLELAAVPVPAGLDGRSLAPLLRAAGQEEAAVPIFAMEHYHWWENGRRRDVAQPRSVPLATAVIEGAQWLIVEGESASLYDMAADPAQLHDLGRAGVTKALWARIDQRHRALPPMQETPVDPALQEQLRSLGYLQ